MQVGLLAAVVAVILGVGYAALRQSLLSEAHGAVTGTTATLLEETDLRQNELVLRIAALARDNRQQRTGMLFLLADAAGGCPAAGPSCPVGNLRAWPEGVPFQAGLYRASGETSMALRVTPIERLGLLLLIGRELPVMDALEGSLAPALAVAAGTAAAVAALLGLLSAGRLLARVEAINAFCSGLGAAGLGVRLPAAGRDEFADLSANINGMLDRIQELMRLLQQVTNHAAHDLRTPLAALRLGLEAGLHRTPDPVAQETLGVAIEQLDEVTETFARMLEIARSEAGGQDGFEPVDLPAVLAPTLAMLGPAAEEAGVRLDADLQPAVLTGSPRLLQLLVANLVGNAIKFSPEGGVVTVRTGQVRGAVQLSVADQGPGIAEADRERVFEHFARVGATDRPGHGLGLPMVRAIARRHGLVVELHDAGPGLVALVSRQPQARFIT